MNFRCVIIPSCRVCPWLHVTSMPGIVHDSDGNPKTILWCIGKDNCTIDLDANDLDSVNINCPLPKMEDCEHGNIAKMQ